MNPSFKIGLIRLFFYGTVSILIFAIAFPLIITPVLNTPLVKNRISAFIYQETGTELDPAKFSLTIFPRASFNINDYNFNPEDRINIQIESLRFNLDVQKLLHGKINIGRLIIDHPVIKSRPLKKKDTALPVDFSISNSITGLKKVFTFLPGDQSSFELAFKNAKSPWFRDMDGTLYLLKEKDEIILNTTIRDIKLKSSSLPVASLERYLDIDSIEMDQIKGIIKLTSTGAIKGRSNFSALKIKSKDSHLLFDLDILDSFFDLSDDFYQVDITPFKLNYPTGSVEIHFTNDKKESDIEFIGANIHIDQARKMSAVLFKDNRITRTLFKILQKGIAPGVNVSFHSKDFKNLFNPDHLMLKGNLENGTVNIPATDLTATRVTGNAGLKGGILDINAQRGMILNSKIEKGSLKLDLLNHANVPFQGDFSLDVDLSMVPETLISLLPDTATAKELSRVHDVKGRAKARLNLSLAPGPGKDLEVKVHTADFNVKGRYDRVPDEISIRKINFTYEPGIISLKRLNGVINGSRVYDLDAAIDFKKDVKINILKGAGEINLDLALPFLMSHEKTREMIQPVKTGTGKLLIASLNLSGPVLRPDLWTYNLSGTGTGIGLGIGTGIEQGNDTKALPAQKSIENLSCHYQISDNFIHLKNMDMKMNSLLWITQLNKKNSLDDLLVPLDMKNGHFQIRKKTSFLKGSLNFTDGPELVIDLSGDKPASLTMNSIKFLDQGFSDATVIFNNTSEKPKFDFSGVLSTDTLNKLFKKNSYWEKKIDALTQGQPVLIHTDKDSTLNIITKSFNLNPILSESVLSEHSVDPLYNNFLPDKPFNFKAEKLKIKDLTLTNVDSRLTLKKDHSYIKINRAFLCDLEAGGYINLKKDVIFAKLPFKANDKENIQDLLTCLFKKNKFIDGQYSLTGTILTEGAPKNSLNRSSGSFILNARNGRIYQLTLLSRILSVFNVSSLFKGTIPDLTQEGFAYKKIIIEADIKDSVIHLTKAIIDGQDMALIFKGWIDPLNDDLDLTCLVAPFKTIDLIVGKIPVLNTLLDGRLLSVPIKASGKLSDPAVIPLHPSAVGTGLVNMMTDILKTPVKLWDKLNAE